MSSFKMSPGEVRVFELPGLTPQANTPSQLGEAFQPFEFGPLGHAGLTEAELADKVHQILAEAQEKVQDIERRAYEQGFLQGQKDGREVGEKSLAEVAQHLRHLALGLEQEKAALYRRWEENLVRLVLIIGEKMTARELAARPETIRNLIERGFQYLSEHENVRLFIHPRDHEILHQDDLTGWPPGLTLVSDGSISPGGFRLETVSGDLDGTREHLWSRVAQAVEEALQNTDGDWDWD